MNKKKIVFLSLIFILNLNFLIKKYAIIKNGISIPIYLKNING